MKASIKSLAFACILIIGVLIVAHPVLGARGEAPVKATFEYKIVPQLGKRVTISNMEKALDSFVEQQKEKAILEIDLKSYGDEGWELVYFERGSNYAIFKRQAQQKK